MGKNHDPVTTRGVAQLRDGLDVWRRRHQHRSHRNGAADCREYTKGARVVICLVSDGQYIYEPTLIPRVLLAMPIPTSPLAPEFPPLFPEPGVFP